MTIVLLLFLLLIPINGQDNGIDCLSNYQDCGTNNCFQISFQSFSTRQKNKSISWSLIDAIRLKTITMRTILNIDETIRTQSICLDENAANSFRCAYIEAYGGNHYGTVQVIWNGVIWANHSYNINQLYPGYDDPLVYIGEYCMPWYVCNQIHGIPLIDVQVTTTDTVDTTKTNNSSDNDLSLIEEMTYWRIYGHYGNERGVILHDPYHRKYQPNTNYRTLLCMNTLSFTCFEFGMKNTSRVQSNYTIRFIDKDNEEIIVTGDDESTWECYEGLCDGDIVTPLQNCSSLMSLSNGEIITIVVGIGIGLILMIGYIVKRYRMKQRRSTVGHDTTTARNSNDQHQVEGKLQHQEKANR